MQSIVILGNRQEVSPPLKHYCTEYINVSDTKPTLQKAYAINSLINILGIFLATSLH
jgi:hypothetical protein